MNLPKARVFNIVQYEQNPVTGESLNFNEHNIIACLSHKTIKKYAYIKHDCDKYTSTDKIPNQWKIGDKKPVHWHIVLKLDKPTDISSIAKWLNVPENYVDVPKGRNVFIECVRYLTHEDEKQQAKGKYLYPDSCVNSNFDFREEITQYELKKTKNKSTREEVEEALLDVAENGLTIRQTINKYGSIMFINNKAKFLSARELYVKNIALPPIRINIYVQGEGGVGKGACSEILGLQLCQDYIVQGYTIDEIIFNAGHDNPFDGYDGQPVIIWNDFRAGELMHTLKGRGNVFNIFDSKPIKQSQNVKYSTMIPTNIFNIVNSVQPYEEFLTQLAVSSDEVSNSNNEDTNQARRRFPVIYKLDECYFQILYNLGFFNGTDEFSKYEQTVKLAGNFAKYRNMLKAKGLYGGEVEVPMLEDTRNRVSKFLDDSYSFATPTDEEVLSYGLPYVSSSTQHVPIEPNELPDEVKEQIDDLLDT